MIVDPDFLDHWRTGMVADAIGDPMAPIYILRLWAHCQERKSDTFVIPSAGLKAQCKCPAKADAFEAALIEAGFIVRNGDSITVVGWAEKNASLIAAWENGSKGGRPKKNPDKTHGLPSCNPAETHGQPMANPDETDKRREEKRRNTGCATTTLKGAGPEISDSVADEFSPTQAGAICIAIKRCGVGDVNPGHPRLAALIEAGATELEFTGFARSAAEKGKGFAWVLGAVEGERKRAAAMTPQLHCGQMPQADTETAWQRSQRQRVEEATGGLLSKRHTTTTTTEPSNVAAITLG